MPMLFRLDKKLTAAVGTCCCQLMISHFQFCKARISSANSPDIVTGVHSSFQNNQPLSVDFPHMEIAEIDGLFSLQFLAGGCAVDAVRFVGSGKIRPDTPLPRWELQRCPQYAPADLGRRHTDSWSRAPLLRCCAGQNRSRDTAQCHRNKYHRRSRTSCGYR